MRYAVLADIHGNLHALRAVLADAKARGAEGYLLLGDYLRGSGFPDEVCHILRALPNCTAVAGNEDERVAALTRKKAKHCRREQMRSDFVVCQSLCAENRAWLCALPKTADVRTPGGRTLRLSHSIPLVDSGADWFRPKHYRRHMAEAPFALEEGWRQMAAQAESQATDIARYSGDACLYGHNHLQFYAWAGGKLLLNPGSCGAPCDHDVRAPYALLHEDPEGLAATPLRVSYDVEAAIADGKATAAALQTPFWFATNAHNLRTGDSAEINAFFEHLFAVQGHRRMPAKNKTWQKALETFAYKGEWPCTENTGSRASTVTTGA
jgi:predicted phosphodiesterase